MTDKDYLSKYLNPEKLEEGLKKLESGYPVQYIVGDVNFYGHKILVNENVLIPRFETELLVYKTINYIKEKFNGSIKILDIGTGSGAIAIALKKAFPLSSVTAIDISEEALDVARKNAEINDVQIAFFKSDLFDKIIDKYDVIISNPPYIAYDEVIDEKVKKYEPHLALYASNDGLKIYERILSNIDKFLNDKFIISFEIGETQGEKIKNIIQRHLNDVQISIERDYPGKERFIFIFN